MDIGFLAFWFVKKPSLKKENIGSTLWRAQWLVNHWPEAEMYQEGKKYDVLVIQKCWPADILEKHDGIIILDLCDPVWISESHRPEWVDKNSMNHYWDIMKIADRVSAITVSSEGLYNALRLLLGPDYPLVWVDDRVDMDVIGPYRKQHKGDAKKVVWFGYRGNGEKSIQPVLSSLRRNKLNLHIISEGDITFPGYEDMITNADFNWNTLPFEMLSCDLAINPPINSPLAQYKSKNKTVLSWAYGLPVVNTADEMERFIHADERIKESERVGEVVKKEYDVIQSVEQYKTLIQTLWEKKHQA